MGKFSSRPAPKIQSQSFGASLFAWLIGLFLLLALWKFGNPAIFEPMIDKPTNFLEIIVQPWPLKWGYWFIAMLAFAGLISGRLDSSKDWQFRLWLLLPLVWLAWQFISATQTVDTKLTFFTLKHFTACVVCFYLGRFVLGRLENLRPVLLGLLAGFAIVLWSGWSQHFGGLEQSRRFFYELPNWREFPPDFIKKVASNRIYGTLFYPNTLAAVILLVLPISIATLWSFKTRLTNGAHGLLVGILTVGALGCLYWSGSKSGWLLSMLMCFVVLLQLKFSPVLKRGLIIGLVVIGLGGFALKYAKFFEKGATSVVARFDYWRAAVQITFENPVLGTGPGTFFIPYQKIKKPESEITRLCHNDYLEQASDSGVLGFLSFATFILGSFVICRPKGDFLAFSVWLGSLGVCLHSLVEFNLYIPAVAWPVFLFLGWLWAKKSVRQQSGESVTSPTTK